jgi:hypothetical protein
VNHTKQEFSKLGFEIGDFWRRSGFVEIDDLKLEAHQWRIVVFWLMRRGRVPKTH